MALIDDLIAFWPLDEASGTRADAHGSNDLTDNNTVTSGTGHVYGTAADFESGNSEFLSRADNTDLSIGDIDFTFAIWVRHESLTNNQELAGKGEAGGFEWVIQRIASDNRYRFRAATGTGEAGVHTVVDGGGFGGGNGPSVDTWYLVLGGHDAANDQIFIRTSLNSFTRYNTGHTGGVWDSAGAFNIGRNGPAFPSYLDGLAGPAMFWKRLLTDQEVTDLFNAGAGLTYAELSGGGGITADVPVGTVAYSANAPASSKLAAAPLALAETAALAPTSSKQATAPLAAVETSALAPASAKSASAPLAACETTAHPPDRSSGATVPLGTVEYLAIAPASSKAAGVPLASVEYVGIAPASTIDEIALPTFHYALRGLAGYAAEVRGGDLTVELLGLSGGLATLRSES